MTHHTQPADHESSRTGHPKGGLRRLLLVDDDPLFGKMLRHQGSLSGVEVVHALSFGAMCQLPDIQSFDMVLLDYDLGLIKGSAIAEFLQLFFARTPVAIVSATSTWWFTSGDDYPPCVRAFIHKDRTFEEMLALAAEIHAQHTAALASGEYKDISEPYPELAMIYGAYRKTMAACGRTLLSGLAKFVPGPPQLSK